MEEDNKNDDKGGKGKGILAGIGAALGIAAIGIGGKIIYDKYSNIKEKETPEENTFSKFKYEETGKIIEKLKKQGNLKPKIINDEFDKNYIRANSIQNTDEEELLKLKSSFICPITNIVMDNPVITPYGTTYEKSAILKYIEENNNDYLTKKPLSKDMIIPNYMLKAAMREYNDSLEL